MKRDESPDPLCVLLEAIHAGGEVGSGNKTTVIEYLSAGALSLQGADLGHVFCPEAAAIVIKSYSPELIVHPIL